MNTDLKTLTSVQMAAEVACLLGAGSTDPGTRRLARDLSRGSDSDRACPDCGHLLRVEPATTEGDPSVIGGTRAIPASMYCVECEFVREVE